MTLNPGHMQFASMNQLTSPFKIICVSLYVISVERGMK